MFNPKSATRIGAIAMAVLMIGTFAAQAEDSASNPYDDCLDSVTKKYTDAVAACAAKYPTSQKKYNNCVTNAQTKLVDGVVACGKYLTFEPIDQGVGGPGSTGLDGWHPKGKKTKGQFDPSSLKGADTSGGQGSGGGSSTGGSNGGGGKALGGTFNSSMSGASMSTGGGSGGII